MCRNVQQLCGQGWATCLEGWFGEQMMTMTMMMMMMMMMMTIAMIIHPLPRPLPSKKITTWRVGWGNIVAWGI